MDENLHLLANPNRYYRKKINQTSIDDKIYSLLKNKFPGIEITQDDYSKNILKIEILFNETYQQRVVETIVEEIVQQTVYEQILF
jgi:hypothetical protein|tara:strand:+ start:4873 stop:5127 length:255 start_codon:yes stop_codon:yes gene_type:complete